jgi:hypothetical protein
MDFIVNKICTLLWLKLSIHANGGTMFPLVKILVSMHVKGLYSDDPFDMHGH